MNPRRPSVFSRVSSLLFGTGALALAHAADPQTHWLDRPCALLQEGDFALVLPASAAPLDAAPYIGRRSSECLWTDTGAQRTLRLVLYPARDSARVASQLQRMLDDDAAAVAFEAGASSALITGDGTQVGLGVGHWMINVFGSEPFDQEGARRLATELALRVTDPPASSP